MMSVLFVALWLLVTPRFAAADVVSHAARVRAHDEGSVPVVVALDSVASRRGLRQRRRAAESLRAAVLRSIPADELTVVQSYGAVAGFTAMATPAALERLAVHPNVRRVDVGGRGGGALPSSVPQIRADRVHARGVEGEGTVVAVLDTGVDEDHPDIADALIDEECFCLSGCCPNNSSRASGPGSAMSRHAHGPHVTGIALSRGHIAGVGVAPRSRLVAVRVLDDRNRGFLADWIAALDWIATDRPDVRVVNMSLASDLSFDGACGEDCTGDAQCAENMLFAELIELLYDRGTLVFAASGNTSSPDRLSSPACVDRAVSVGSVTSIDEITATSNASEHLDLLAPGVAIVSDAPDGDLAILSGTSMATPHAAGTAALLLAAKPGATAERVEHSLKDSGVPVFDRRNGRWFPRVDALAALNAVSATAELQRGGGSRASDCLLEWNVIPPESVAPGGRSAVCADGNPACDGDGVPGQCTFLLSLCFNVPDPLLRQCDPSETISSLDVARPRADAPTGTAEQINADVLHHSLPSFPIEARGVCSPAFPVIVPRPHDVDGVTDLRLVASTATRRDYDRFALRCTTSRD